MSAGQALIINGWCIYAHPLFISQVEELTEQVERLRQKYPQDYQQKNATKRLAAINKLAFEIIPQDPTRPEYRQGNTLGSGYKHWFRAKFFSNIVCSFDIISNKKLLSMLGLMMKSLSVRMKIKLMLIEYLKRC
ncbi:MAG: hypothetical protein RLZZ499_3073 [Cyanobacteriota bacterium]